jgi:hypothetical protein
VTIITVPLLLLVLLIPTEDVIITVPLLLLVVLIIAIAVAPTEDVIITVPLLLILAEDVIITVSMARIILTVRAVDIIASMAAMGLGLGTQHVMAFGDCNYCRPDNRHNDHNCDDNSGFPDFQEHHVHSNEYYERIQAYILLFSFLEVNLKMLC